MIHGILPMQSMSFTVFFHNPSSQSNTCSITRARSVTFTAQPCSKHKARLHQ